MELEAMQGEDHFLGPFTLITREMAYTAPTKGFPWPSPDTAILFAPFRSTHPPPPVAHFLLIQNLSPKAG